MGKNKIFVLDTNVLLYDPNALGNFGENTIVTQSRSVNSNCLQ